MALVSKRERERESSNNNCAACKLDAYLRLLALFQRLRVLPTFGTAAPLPS